MTSIHDRLSLRGIEMRQKNLWHWYRRLMRAEQKQTSLKAAIFPAQKRDGPAPVFIEPELAIKQEAPESLLSERLLIKRLQAMNPLGNGAYVDRSLITCVEYQLFLDAQRLHGRFYQPDHWKTLSVPEGQSREAVLGVRASDARAFCQWLTKRDKEGWQYRLPTLDEWNALESSDKPLNEGLPSPVGCWISMESNTAWRGRKPLLIDMMSSTMQSCLTRDWACQPDDVANFARPLRLVQGLTRLLACDAQRDLAQHLAHTFERLQGCDLEQSFALAQESAAILKQIQILAIAHSSEFQRALVGDRSGTRTADERARMFTYVRNLVNLLYSAGDVSHDLLPMLRQALDRGEGSTAPLSERESGKGSHSDDRKMPLLASLRSCTLHLTCFLCKLGSYLFSEDVMAWFQQYLWLKDYADLDKGAFERAIAGYLDLYLVLVILELRRQEQIPAWEGILLVKERCE
jgi:hypothetical protein